MKLFEILFAESKRVWYRTQNEPNPAFDQWYSDYYSVDDPEKFYKDNPRPGPKLERDVPARFDIRVLRRKLPTYESKLRYLRDTCLHIGEGSSRVVFAVSPKQVIKLAGGEGLSNDAESVKSPDMEMSNMRKAGEYQNKREYELYEKGMKGGYGELFPRVFEIADDDSWLLSELVRPLSDESELRDMMGFKNNQAMFDRAMALFTTKDGWKSKWGSELLLSLGDENGKYVRLVVKLLQDNPNVLAGDLEPVEQWGKGSDGRLVLLDVGGDNEMMKRFYNR
jgi:hypothetical protein